MITKGYVVEIIDEFNIKVRMPIIDAIEGAREATTNDNLSIATICSLPNISNQLSVGDVVFVGFEDNDIGKPVILGHLFKQDSNIISDNSVPLYNNTLLNGVFGQLFTNSITKLNKITYIGDITPTEISYLQGAKDNLQAQIDELKRELQELKETK